MTQIHFLISLALFASKSALCMACALAIALAGRKLAAAHRHAILLAAFCAILALPVLGLFLPARPIRLPQNAAHAEASPFPSYRAVPTAAAEPTPNLSLPPALERHSNPPPAVPPKPDTPWLPSSAPAILIAMWLAGVLIVLAHYLLACLILARAASKKVEIPEVCQEASKRAGLTRRWTLQLSPLADSSGPMTWGIARPIVAMPMSSLSWDRDRFLTVLAHELVHVRRRDCLAQSVALAACALNWFNPLPWVCFRALRSQAELAADEAVLLSGVKPSAYAEVLLKTASRNRSTRLLYPGVPLMKHPNIESRIKRILDPLRPAKNLSRPAAAVTFAAAALVAAACATVQIAAANPTKPNRKNSTVLHRAAPNHRELSKVEERLNRLEAEIDQLKKSLADQRPPFVQIPLPRRQGLSEQRQSPWRLIQKEQAEIAAQRDQLDAAQAKISAEKAQIGAAQQDYARQKHLYGVGSVDQKSLIDSSARLQSQQAELIASQDKLKAEQIEDATLGGARSQDRIHRLMQDENRDIQARETQSMKAQLAAANARIAELEAKIRALLAQKGK